MSSLPFNIEIKPGSPAYEQVIQSVHRGVAKGLIREGDAFPSVRALSKAVGINPNTAHKVVQALVTAGTLEVMPGRGTRVAPPQERTSGQRLELIRKQLDELVIEARRLGFGKQDLSEAIQQAWNTYDKSTPNTQHYE